MLLWEDAALGSEDWAGSQELCDRLSVPASPLLEACSEGKAELVAELRPSSAPLQALSEGNVGLERGMLREVGGGALKETPYPFMYSIILFFFNKYLWSICGIVGTYTKTHTKCIFVKYVL